MKSPSRRHERTNPRRSLLVAILATMLVAASLAGGFASASAQIEECVVAAPSLQQAKADFAASCSEPRIDCDKLDATWYCSDRVIGGAAPNGVEGPASTIVPVTPVVDPPVMEEPSEPEPPVEDPPADEGLTELATCTATARSLADAKALYADTCDAPRRDCDPVAAGWLCSGEMVGDSAPATPTPVEPEVPVEPETPVEPEEPTTNCQANTSDKVNLANDLISLHYDHAPDRDDAHATAAGKTVALDVGFTPWVIGGAYGADNRTRYKPASEAVMDAVWGPSNWVNADDNWNRAVQLTADRWDQTLSNCGDIWIAEGGQSDLSADIVRELKTRDSSLDANARIHLVQHSGWNERQALDADLAYVQANTDYIKIDSGNKGGNGTAAFNEENYRGRFIQAALNGPVSNGWESAFDYYPTNQRLDFSDTVELMEILDINIDEVATINEFSDRFMGSTVAQPEVPPAQPVEPANPLPAGLHPDIVEVKDVPGRTPGGRGWADSYSVGNECYCATTFDHNIGGIVVDTPDGPKTVRDVCNTLGDGPGIEGRPIYNDIQCGNGPANDAGDEDDCPGRVDIGREGCGQIGPKWNLSVFRR